MQLNAVTECAFTPEHWKHGAVVRAKHKRECRLCRDELLLISALFGFPFPCERCACYKMLHVIEKESMIALWNIFPSPQSSPHIPCKHTHTLARTESKLDGFL